MHLRVISAYEILKGGRSKDYLRLPDTAKLPDKYMVFPEAFLDSQAAFGTVGA